MARYSIVAHVVAGKYLGVVEANSVEEAKEKAAKLDTCHISLCHQCSGECEDAQIVDFDADLEWVKQ